MINSRLPIVEMQDIGAEGFDAAKARVLIAKDALALIQVEYLKPVHTAYLSPVIEGTRFSTGGMAHALFNEADGCNVCAIGALFVASVRRFDKLEASYLLNVSGYINAHRVDLTEYLEQLFSGEEMNFIEYVFEGNSDTFNNELSIEQEKILDDYRESVVVDNALSDDVAAHMLLVTILNNIITNDGTFVVPGLAEAPPWEDCDDEDLDDEDEDLDDEE